MSGLVNVTLANQSPTVDVELDTLTVEVTVPSTVVVDADVTETGPAGPGLPTGGTTGQVAAKASNANYDVHWVSGGGGDMLAANNLSELTDDSAARSNLGLGTAATHNTGDYDTIGAAVAAQAAAIAASDPVGSAAAAQSAAIAASQPVDSDLTAIAALSTTSYGRGLLTLADAAAARAAIGAGTGGGDMVGSNNLSELTNTTTARSNLGLGSAATHATTDYDASGAAAAAQAASQPVDSDLTAIAALTTTAYGRAFLALADAAAGRTALGLGTAATHATGDYDAAGAAAAAQAASQPLDGDLTTIAGLTATTDNMIQSVSSAWASRTPAQVKAALAIANTDVSGLGTASTHAAGDFQPIDTDLTTIAGLTATTDNFMVANASAWASRTPTQAKASLAIANTDVSGLGTMSTVSNTAASVPIVDAGSLITATNVETALQEIVTNLNLAATIASNASAYIPVFAKITSTSTAKNANTTVSDVTGLVVALTAASTYIVDAYIIYQSSTTADIKIGWTTPTSVTGTWGLFGPSLTATTQDSTIQFGTPGSWASASTAGGVGATSLIARASGVIVTSGGNAGNLQLQMAQATSDATDTTLRANSYVTARKVA